ncbi:pyocin activator PrtN family protein [Celeribacter halophilus]|jgi:hypothetical protein|uniref:pyocin activator PrtN family protein n=1 Tax=Celeribacter halophilus TaxID=576117 RepID=UPI003A931DE1
MTTLMLLLARHDGRDEITFAQMAREYFRLEPDALERKIKKGVIDFKLSTDRRNSIRANKIPLPQLAHYIEQRRAAAIARMDEYAAN